VEAISDKTLSSTVALTAARGRGKSAALGLAIGAAVANDYSNIFVTSPDPENLKTLFEFVLKALEALGYIEHEDYDVIQSTNPDFKKVVVRINIFRGHRQTIQVSLTVSRGDPGADFIPVYRSRGRACTRSGRARYHR
jgi:N-acetyltransferase 10